MASENHLLRLRREFKIPNNVLIFAGERININQSEIGKQPANNKYNIPQGPQPDTPTQVLIYTALTLRVPEYTDNIGRVVSQQEKTYQAILLKVSQDKRVVTTEIQGRDGSVKEYIGMSDYDVVVNGIITSANGVNPQNEISILKRILDAPVAMEVASGYLQNLGIYSLVTFTYDLEQQPGSYSYQTFTINFRSDVPQELRISGV